MHFLQGKHDWLISRMTTEDEQILVRLLPTFRKIKRFARLLVTNSSFITKKLGHKNVDLYDLFLIELVHFCSQDIYIILRDKPEVMLDVVLDERTKLPRYSLKQSYENELEENISWSITNEENKLLRKCFEKRASDNIHFLVYVDSYLNYFCLATPSVLVSKEEFDEVVKDRSTIRKNIHDWVWKLMPKKSASLYCRMIKVRAKNLSLEEWCNHVYLIAAWICETEDQTISEILCKYLLLETLHFDEEDAEMTAKRFFYSKFEMMNGSKVNRKNVAKVLCGFYAQIESEQEKYLFCCNEIKELLKNNFMRFMSEKQSRQDAINVVALNGNDINAFVKANYITKVGEASPRSESSLITYENLIIDDVIDYFSAYDVKSSHMEEAKNMYTGSTNRYKTIPGLSGTDLEKEKYMILALMRIIRNS